MKRELKQGKFELKQKSFIKENQAVKTSLDKLRTLIITLLGKLRENVGRTFYKVKIQPQEFTQMTKTGTE